VHAVIVGVIIDNLPLETRAIIPPQPLSCIPNLFDPTVAKMRIGVKYLTCPGAFVQYKGIPGMTGKVLGIWSVLMQVNLLLSFHTEEYSEYRNRQFSHTADQRYMLVTRYIILPT
jgi:hypothetical protein